jgi:integrase
LRAGCGKPPADADDPPECAETCADPAHQLLAGTRFHDLRHFYASALIAANLNPKIIQARLGHATLAETMDTYGHLLRTLTTSAAPPSTSSSGPK